MTYVATNPEKLDSVKFKQWQKLANLKPSHMHAINNLEYMGVAVYKRESMSVGLSFGTKKKRQTRKARGDNEEEWELSRFQPVLSEVLCVSCPFLASVPLQITCEKCSAMETNQGTVIISRVCSATCMTGELIISQTRLM